MDQRRRVAKEILSMNHGPCAVSAETGGYPWSVGVYLSVAQDEPATWERREAMEYRRLGNSGLKVSPICLGTMMFGNQTDEAVAGRIVDSAFGAGINFIDTADSYAKGGS